MALIRSFRIGHAEQEKQDAAQEKIDKRERIKQEYIYTAADQIYRAFILGLCGAALLFPIVSAVVFALKW